MSYRDDLDAFGRRRAEDDAEAALLASFHRSQRTNRRRGLALALGGLVAAVVLLVGWQLATPPVTDGASRRSARIAAAVRACVREVVDEWYPRRSLHWCGAERDAERDSRPSSKELVRRCLNP